MRTLRLLIGAASVGALVVLAACGESSTTPAGSDGTVVVKMTDAPFPSDSVSQVNVFVTRVEARTAAAEDADAAANLDNSASAGWQVLASPNAAFNLLTFRNGAAATLGQTAIAAGTYNGLRLVIDPSKSNVVLKNGTTLNGTSSPNITFPSGSQSGLKIVLSKPLTVVAGATTTLLVDFDLDNSFVMRGNSISKNGLLFKPVIKASITDAATVNASVRLSNATSQTLTLNQNGAALTGASALAFGASSTCSSVSAATPQLTITAAGSATPLAGFSTALTAGNNYTIVAYPGLTATQFVTLRTNSFTPATGQAGLQIFNASGLALALDAFVTAPGAALGTATAANVATGNSSAFVSVPAGAQQIRLTSTGATAVLLDVGSVTLTAGQNAILVIAPPATGSTTPRAFLVTGC
jgi:hypothetical protein